MPNIENFQTDTSVLSELYTKYTVSRVIANKNDDLLDMEIPADFPEQILGNNIEINLYSLADNSLIVSDIIKNSQAIKIETLQYNDNTLRRLLYIDFAKAFDSVENTQNIIPSGQYSVTLNFFSDEIGSYDNRILKVSRISTSRREVELKLTDLSQIESLQKLATPVIPVQYIEPVLKQIFNQDGADDVFVPTSPVRINSSSLYENFESGSGQLLLQYNFDDDNGTQPGINTIMQNTLNIAYPIALTRVRNQIIASGSTVFTEEQLFNYVLNAIDEAYDDILNDEAQNPSKYRFDLI